MIIDTLQLILVSLLNFTYLDIFLIVITYCMSYILRFSLFPNLSYLLRENVYLL